MSAFHFTPSHDDNVTGDINGNHGDDDNSSALQCDSDMSRKVSSKMQKQMNKKEVSSRMKKQQVSIRKDKRKVNLLTKRLKLSSDQTFTHGQFPVIGGGDTSVDESKGANDKETQITVIMEIQEQIKNADDHPNQVESLRRLRQVLCQCEPPIEFILRDALMIPTIIHFLHNSDEAVKLDALWCLTNLATGTQTEASNVLHAVPDLLNIISGEDLSLAEQACWCIGNLAGDSDEFRSILLSNGALVPLLQFLNKSIESSTNANDGDGVSLALPEDDFGVKAAQTVTWTLSNLARGSTPAAAFIEHNAIELLLHLTMHPDAILKIEAWWVLTYLTIKEEESVDSLVEAGLIDALNVAMGTMGTMDCTDIFVPIVRSIGNLSSGPVHWIDHLVDMARNPNILGMLHALTAQDLQINNMSIIKESLWAIANILGGTPEQRSVAYQFDFVLNFASILQCDSFDLQKEAMFALRNICHDSTPLLRIMQDQAVLSVILTKIEEFVKSPEIYSEVVLPCIDVLRVMTELSSDARAEVLRLCTNAGILSAIDDLQYGNVDNSIKYAAGNFLEDTEIGSDEEEGEEEGFEVEIEQVPRPAMGRGMHLAQPSWMET